MDITLDGTEYIICKIREHESHMLACDIYHQTETLEGSTRKVEDVFLRKIEIGRNLIRYFEEEGYGLGDRAGFFVNFEGDDANCKLLEYEKVNGEGRADILNCKLEAW